MPKREPQRIAFTMWVEPACQQEYIRRHHPIWPELESILRAHGVLSYSIFLDEQASQLFAYAEIEDYAKWEDIAQTDVCRRWWRYMSEIMPANADYSPLSCDLKEAFHMKSDESYTGKHMAERPRKTNRQG